MLVLFGGKGSGKSTFIKRLLHHNPPRWLNDNAVIAIIDLLKVPEEPEVIRRAIWDTLVNSLDREQLLSADRAAILDQLFKDRFEISSRQELAGLPRSSEAYNARLNSLVSEWKSDKAYCARRLVDNWRSQGKGVIVVVDNTDQYTGPNQDFCFSSAQEISAALECVTIISMREERFHNSKIHGVLDAFQNSGFHISSPKPSQVFKKRLAYVASLLESPRKRSRFFEAIDNSLVSQCIKYLTVIIREFSSENSPLNRFLTACAHGDTRLSLDLFRSFLLSGYTNVEEMLNAGQWVFQPHQVIKPVMIPSRYFYDETLSEIPNVLQIRNVRHGSHFTALRILRNLAKNVDGAIAAYSPMSQLKSYFSDSFNMIDDFISNVDMLLKSGFIESENRLDAYDDSIANVKITGYGLYMLNELALSFTYLDIVCTDTGICREETSNYLAEAARSEFRLFERGERTERVRKRLDRVEKFVAYLQSEEEREKETYGLVFPASEAFGTQCQASFDKERDAVLASAIRQGDKRRGGRKRPGKW